MKLFILFIARSNITVRNAEFRAMRTVPETIPYETESGDYNTPYIIIALRAPPISGYRPEMRVTFAVGNTRSKTDGKRFEAIILHGIVGRGLNVDTNVCTTSSIFIISTGIEKKNWTHLRLLSIPRQTGGKIVKTLRWEHRLQRQKFFMVFNRIP